MTIGPDFVFICVPRTASVAMTEWLKHYGGEALSPSEYHRRDVPTAHQHKFTFAVVRNPYERVVSMWRLLRKFSETDLDYIGLSADPTLSDVVRWMMATPYPAYWNQVRFLETARIDAMLRYENLETELRSLPFVQKWTPLPVMNTGDRKPISEDLTGEAVRLINQCCAETFEKFNYARY